PMESVTIPLSGSDTIAATLWQAPDPRAVVLLHPATAVTQRYYEAFAHYLHGLGLHVLTYDYRGTGRSRPRDLRQCTVTMAEWMEDDNAAVTRWAAARFPGLPLLAVGHSVGGHAIALSSATGMLTAGVLVASHAGVTRTIRGAVERARVWCVMRLLAPVLCRVLGYMPGRRIGLGEDLPRTVMLQWSRWTTLPGYFLDDATMDARRRMARVRVPLLVLGFDDDPWANPRAISILVQPLVNARMERRQVAPRDARLPAIGHMGFFRRQCAPTLWPQVADWLLAHCPVKETAR
ncbi:alpha/beta fold hydrolase, partial [Telluria sp. Tellsp99]